MAVCLFSGQCYPSDGRIRRINHNFMFYLAIILFAIMKHSVRFHWPPAWQQHPSFLMVASVKARTKVLDYTLHRNGAKPIHPVPSGAIVSVEHGSMDIVSGRVQVVNMRAKWATMARITKCSCTSCVLAFAADLAQFASCRTLHVTMRRRASSFKDYDLVLGTFLVAFATLTTIKKLFATRRAPQIERCLRSSTGSYPARSFHHKSGTFF